VASLLLNLLTGSVGVANSVCTWLNLHTSCANSIAYSAGQRAALCEVVHQRKGSFSSHLFQGGQAAQCTHWHFISRRRLSCPLIQGLLFFLLAGPILMPTATYAPCVCLFSCLLISDQYLNTQHITTAISFFFPTVRIRSCHYFGIAASWKTSRFYIHFISIGAHATSHQIRRSSRSRDDEFHYTQKLEKPSLCFVTLNKYLGCRTRNSSCKWFSALIFLRMPWLDQTLDKQFVF